MTDPSTPFPIGDRDGHPSESRVWAAASRVVFAHAPGFAILMSGPEHQVEFVNDAHQHLFGSADWVGKPIREAFPDIEGQGFFELRDAHWMPASTYT